MLEGVAFLHKGVMLQAHIALHGMEPAHAAAKGGQDPFGPVGCKPRLLRSDPLHDLRFDQIWDVKALILVLVLVTCVHCIPRGFPPPRFDRCR